MSNCNGESRALVAASAAPLRPMQQPMNLDNLERIGTILAQSGFFADAKDVAKAVAKVLAGHELGIGPFASMTNVYLVQGRASLSATMMAAIIKKSGRYTYRVVKHDSKECEIDFYEIGPLGTDKIGTSTFTMQDAAAAGLLSNQTWKKYPRNMLFARAMSNGARWYAPDAFGGNTPYTPDEINPDVPMDMGADGGMMPRAEVVTAEAPGGVTAPAKKRQRRQAAATPEVEARQKLQTYLQKFQIDVPAFLKYYRAATLEDMVIEDVLHANDLFGKRQDIATLTGNEASEETEASEGEASN